MQRPAERAVAGRRVGRSVQVTAGARHVGRATFVGRVEALGTLDAAAELAGAGQPQVVVVQGEAGIGKSALLTSFSGRLDGFTVLAASGDELEISLEFGLVDQLLGHRKGWKEPYAAGLGVLQYLGHASADQHCLVLIDDAHLADQPSLAALNFMFRRLGTDPVILVLGLRPEGTSSVPAGLLRRAKGAGAVVELGGLSAEEVQALACARDVGALTRRAAERLRVHTGGSPLHLCALLDEIPASTLEAMEQPLPAPRSFALLVLRDVARLTPAAQRLVSTAAVLGERADTRVLLNVSGIDPSQAPATLEELHQHGLLTLPPGADQVRFRHPLIRAAISDDLGPGTRIELHRRAAALLPGAAGVRHRVAATLAPDATLASELEQHALEQAHAGHLAAAANDWLTASRFSANSEDAGRRLLHGVDLLLATGDVATATAHTNRVDALPESGPRLYVQARAALLTGHADEASALGRRAWERLSELGPGQGDQLAAMLAQIDVLRDRGAEAARWAATALQGDLDPAQARHTRALRAQTLMVSGQGHLGLAELADLPDNPHDVDRARHPELAARGILRTALGQLEAGEKDLLVAASLDYGDLSPFRLTARAQLATARFRRGDWTPAQVVAEEVVSLAADMEQHWLAAFLHATAALVPAGRGEWESARRHVEAAHAAAARLAEPASAHYADDADIFLAMCRGDAAQVVRIAATMIDGDTTPREPGILTWPVHLVAALIQLRRLNEAEHELDRLEDLARRRGHPSRLAAAARLRGQLADSRRDQHTARAAFDQAMSLGRDDAEGVDADERAVAHLAYAAFLRRRGERRAAIAHAREARARYTALGARPFVQRADRLLNACGINDDTTTVIEDWASPLTPQERAVATLIATGRTNQQAANELVVSAKTVSFHLQNVYAKLNVHSRAQLTRRLSEGPQSLRSTPA